MLSLLVANFTLACLFIYGHGNMPNLASFVVILWWIIGICDLFSRFMSKEMIAKLLEEGETVTYLYLALMVGIVGMLLSYDYLFLPVVLFLGAIWRCTCVINYKNGKAKEEEQ